MYYIILLIIFVCFFCFTLFQFIEFIQNYSYILEFNKKYNKYEYASSPSYNYVDPNIYDPNDNETNLDKKWRCVSENNYWYGISIQGMVIIDDKFGEWNNKFDCYSNIFNSYILNYTDPCVKNSSNNYCNIIKKHFPNKLIFVEKT